MTSSNAFDTSIQTAGREHVPAVTKHDNKNRNKNADTTFSPITEITQTNASNPFSSQINFNPNSISKIPHPRAVVLANNKSIQIQRSASLRLRGTKSNLLFDTLNKMETEEMEHGTKENTARTEHNANTKDADETHNISTTGRVSPRRKLVLNSHNSADGLQRSLSLRRSCNLGHKTESPKETCIAANPNPTARELFPEDINSDSPAKLEDTSVGSVIVEREVPDGIAAENHINGGVDEKSNNDIMEANSKDINKMSTNLNGAGATASSTLTAAINAATAATTTTPVRPATLVTTTTETTPTNITTSSKSATTPKTPKTPTTNSHQVSSNANNCHQHHSAATTAANSKHHYYCTKQPPLSSVPETKLTPKTPPVTPDSPSTYLDNDLDSLYSFATTTSGRSTMSCEHPYVARNGTTFSGRKMKYVVHCSHYAGQVGAEYLTPTQRAQRQIRRLNELLCSARQDLEQKDSEIVRLTREVVELRLFKASLSSPEERSASSDAVTVREAELKTSQDVSPIVDMVDDVVSKSSPRHIVGASAGHHHHHHQHHMQHHHQHNSSSSHNSSQHSAMQHSSEMQSSFADSGHFEDMSVHSKDSKDCACGSDEAGGLGAVAAEEASSAEYELQRQELIRLYEQRIEELIRNQDTATSEMKRSHNDKVEALLQKLAECNTRYADIVPDYEHAKERIRELEKQLEELERKLAEHEEKQNRMYLHMYQKGQEAERIARADQALELAHRAPNNKVSIHELLHQLQSTQDELENIRTIYRRLLEAQKNRTHVDPEVTLQFLKSAVYYFLTDKENSQGHLQAIESILEFTEAEKQNINKANPSAK